MLLSTATHTQPARELSDAQLGTPDRVLRRSCMSSYSLPLPASVAITRNSFGFVWTSLRYSAQPPAPNPHESSPMRSLVHSIGSCKGPACVAHPYPFLGVSVTRSSIKSHYYIASGRVASGRVASGRVASGRVASGRVASDRIASGRVTLPARVSLHRVTLHQVAMHRVALHRVALHRVCSPLLSLSL